MESNKSRRIVYAIQNKKIIRKEFCYTWKEYQATLTDFIFHYFLFDDIKIYSVLEHNGETYGFK